MKTTVIGIDFSTDPTKTGLARALVQVAPTSAKLREVCTASKRTPPVKIVAGWIRNLADEAPVLIAIDAPLGWPNAMRDDEFVQHDAGQRVDVCADVLFLRETDRWIERHLRKKPLAVGADKIARTAHAALRFLCDLSNELGIEHVPLAWSPEDVQKKYALSVIEIYPAATLRAHEINAGSYKKSGKDGMDDRKRIIEELQQRGLQKNIDFSRVARKDDTVDAAVAVLAGRDFLVGISESPPEPLCPQLKREGWIWTKVPPAPASPRDPLSGRHGGVQ